MSTKAVIQKWNDPNDNVDVAYQNLQASLSDASIFADRYERALRGAKVTTPEAHAVLAGRAGWASLAASVLKTLYTNTQ